MRIIIDKFQLYDGKNHAVEVTDADTYKTARHLILQSKLSHIEIHKDILVSIAPYIHWFNDVPELKNEITPKSELVRKYTNCQISEELDNESIIDLGLLNSMVVPADNDLFQHFFGTYPPQELTSISTIYKLAKIVNDKKEFLANSYLKKLWRASLSKLLDNCSEVLKKIILPIIDTDELVAEIIAEGIYCSKSKNYLENYLHDNKRLFIEMGLSTEIVHELISLQSLMYETDTRFEKKMQHFVLDNLRSGIINFDEISGNYEGELLAILDISPQLDLNSYGILLEKFTGKLNPIQQQKLLSLCMPEYTEPPHIEGLNLSKQTELWKKWAIEHFIPYKFYFDTAIEKSNSELDNIETGSLMFSDWFFANYGSIINDANIFTNLGVVDHVRTQMDEDSTRVIWLIIDGLPAHYSSILSGTLKKHGINKVDLNWSLATLPTITELGIPIMLSGRFQSSFDKKEKREELLKRGFHSEKKCLYTTKQSEFQKYLKSEYNLCCIHTHEIDTLMHKGDSEFDKTRDEAVVQILDNRILMIANIIKQNPDSVYKLIISTDHGATKCLKNGQGIKNTKLNESAKSNPGERCVALVDNLKKEIIDPQEIYLLKKEISRNNEDWAIARGYHYFGSNDTGYRHGGLSPEEVVVPVMFCEIAPSHEAELIFRYISTKDLRFGKTEKDFRIKVKNAGSTTVEILEIVVAEDPNCILNLPAKIISEGELNLTGNIKIPQKFKSKSKGGKLSLNLAVKSQIMGHEITKNFIITVATEKDDFEDDFEF